MTLPMRSKKVVHLITRLDDWGGAQIHVLGLARQWHQSEDEIEIWGGGDPLPVFTQSPITIRAVAIKRALSAIDDLRGLWELVLTIHQQHPDVIVLHSSKAGVLGRLAALATGTPCVFTIHGWAFSSGMPLRQRLAGWAFEFVAAFWGRYQIAVSNYDRDLGRRFGVTSCEGCFVVHNGSSDVCQEKRARPAESCRIVMVARHCPQKDHATLLQAVKELKGEWYLDLVGDGPDMPATQSLITDLGLSERVRLLGARHDVENFLSQAGIAVLSTNWEGLPLSIIEAMRSGLPVIASAVGGNGELVLDGMNGFIVPRGDARALAHKLQLLLNDRSLRARQGAESRKFYERGFTSGIHFRKARAVVNHVIESSDPFSVV